MAGSTIAIIDSGGANIASLLYAVERLGASATLTTNADRIRSANVYLGAQPVADRLRECQLIDVIRGLTQPVLGICLGMQLLTDASEEEDVDCLGIIPGTARRLPADTTCPVPNMGWCAVTSIGSHTILRSIDDGSYFYFLHSYALPVSRYTIATTSFSNLPLLTGPES